MVTAAALAWSLFAFGAVYSWAIPPLFMLALAAAILAGARPEFRDPVDLAGITVLVVIAAQLLPLPFMVRAVLSPAADTYRGAMLLDYEPGAWAPLTIDPRRTRLMLMTAAAALAVWAAVRALGGSDRRLVARLVAWTALPASMLGLGQRMLFPSGRIYGFWTPLEPGAAPFGAVINRNHFAAWAIMAVLISMGALAAHLARSRDAQTRRAAIAAAVGDGRALWLLFAAAVTVAAIVVTASRSGFAALVAAAIAALALMRRRASGRALAAAGAGAVVCFALALTLARPDRLITRMDTEGIGGRDTIWRESLAIARDYPLAGVGAGAFPAAMAHYQRSTRAVFFNHAHNQYLEWLVEGGALLAIPLLALIIASARRALRMLRSDASTTFWLRLGACAALAGLGVACLWESPFRTPATLMLAAAAAGLATARHGD